MEPVAHTLEDRIRRMTPVAARPEERVRYEALLSAMERFAHTPRRGPTECRLVGPQGESIPLPDAVFHVLERVVEVLARGDSITVVPVGREVTTQQAADLLNVSRQYFVRLLDEGRLPYRKTGKHRRIRIEDVLAYKETRDEERRKGLRDLTRMTEEFGGYEVEDVK